MVMVEEIKRILAKLDEKDRRILQCAQREFSAHGFHNASMDRIAAAAGFGKGTVYRRFGTKQLLFFVAVKSVHIELNKVMAQTGAGLSFKKRLYAKFTVITDHFAANKEGVRLMMNEQSKILEGLNTAEKHELVCMIFEGQYQFWRDMLEEAAEEGILVADADTDVPMLISLLAGLLRGSFLEFFFSYGADDFGMADRWNTLLTKILFEGVFVQNEKSKGGAESLS
jgi:AcrR family transcriptional regulator